MTASRRRWPWLALWVFVALIVWNGVFDLLVTRGVKEYLYREAEHEAGRGPEVTMKAIMGQTIGDAALTASLWALFVAAGGAATVCYCNRVSIPR